MLSHNPIPGLIVSVIFIAFAAGPAESIGVVPFAIIVAIVVAMMLWDFVTSAKAGPVQGRQELSREPARRGPVAE